MSFDVTTLALAKSYTDQHGGGGGASTAGRTNLSVAAVTEMFNSLPDISGSTARTITLKKRPPRMKESRNPLLRWRQIKDGRW